MSKHLSFYDTCIHVGSSITGIVPDWEFYVKYPQFSSKYPSGHNLAVLVLIMEIINDKIEEY